MISAALALAALASSNPALAVEEDNPYFQITSVTISEYEDEADLTRIPVGQLEDPVPNPDDPVVIIDQIINIGKKVWKIIEENKPVVNVREDVASAMPKGVNDWASLEGWHAPRSKVYGMAFTNGFGMEVIKYHFRVLYTAGGSYDGKGQYLSRVTVVPAELNVAWAYKFNSDASIPMVTNAGTKTSPLAQAEILVRWQIDTNVKHSRGSASFVTRGDGTFVHLTNNLLQSNEENP